MKNLLNRFKTLKTWQKISVALAPIALFGFFVGENSTQALIGEQMAAVQNERLVTEQLARLRLHGYWDQTCAPDRELKQFAANEWKYMKRERPAIITRVEINGSRVTFHFSNLMYDKYNSADITILSNNTFDVTGYGTPDGTHKASGGATTLKRCT